MTRGERSRVELFGKEKKTKKKKNKKNKERQEISGFHSKDTKNFRPPIFSTCNLLVCGEYFSRVRDDKDTRIRFIDNS